MEKFKTSKVLMVRPICFGFNEETAVNNYYQQNDGAASNDIQSKALIEFDNMVEKLKANGVDVRVLQDTKDPYTPDSIFPNNWFSTHKDILVLYPMFAKNRRLERREDIRDLIDEYGKIKKIDYSPKEENEIFLEGTGSLVLDRENKKAYCALSPRANETLLDEFCKDLGYKKIAFSSYQTVENERKLIYHTNVMMAMGEKYAILCSECIDDFDERIKVIAELEENKKEIVFITEEQVQNFLGNAIELENDKKESLLIMSSTAYNVLTKEQKETIEKYSKIIPVDVSTIEKYGGGSARCMIAEMYI